MFAFSLSLPRVLRMFNACCFSRYQLNLFFKWESWVRSAYINVSSLVSWSLANLHVFVFSAVVSRRAKSNVSREDINCSICQYSLNGSDVTQLYPCKHNFHKECINKLRKHNPQVRMKRDAIFLDKRDKLSNQKSTWPYCFFTFQALCPNCRRVIKHMIWIEHTLVRLASFDPFIPSLANMHCYISYP